MKHLTGLTLFLLALTARSVCAQTWENLPEKQITALIEKKDTSEILRIQKNSTRPRKGGTLYSRERFLVEGLVTSRDFRVLKLLLDNGLPTRYMPDYYEYSLLNMSIPLGDSKGDLELFKLLLPYCQPTGIEITRVVGAGAVDMYRLLVQRGVNFDTNADFYTIAGGPPTPQCSLFGLAIMVRAYGIAKSMYLDYPSIDVNALISLPDFGGLSDPTPGYRMISRKETPYDTVVKEGNSEMAAWLKAQGGRPFRELAPRLLSWNPERYIQATARSTTDRLRLRDGSDLKAKVTGHLSKGEEVGVVNVVLEKATIDGLTSHWYLVYTHRNVLGWVFGGYLDFSSP
jgi:hypothetical protein